MKRLNGHRAEFEHRAEELREKLLRTISALDRRRHTLLDVRHQVRQRAGDAAVFSMVAVLVMTGLAAVLGARAHRREEPGRGERVRALARVWRHPDRVAAASAKPSVLREIGRRVLVGTVTFVAMMLVRRGVSLTVASRAPTGPEERALRGTRLLPT